MLERQGSVGQELAPVSGARDTQHVAQWEPRESLACYQSSYKVGLAVTSVERGGVRVAGRVRDRRDAESHMVSQGSDMAMQGRNSVVVPRCLLDGTSPHWQGDS